MLLPAECVATGDSIFHLSLPLKSAASNNLFFLLKMKEMCNQESENSASPVLRVRPLTGASGAGGSATERRLGGIPTMLITSFTWTGSNLHTTRKHIKHKHTKPRTLVSLVCSGEAGSGSRSSFGRLFLGPKKKSVPKKLLLFESCVWKNRQT